MVSDFVFLCVLIFVCSCVFVFFSCVFSLFLKIIMLFVCFPIYFLKEEKTVVVKFGGCGRGEDPRGDGKS